MKKVKLNPFYTSDYLTKGKVYDVLDEDEENRYMLLDDDGEKAWFRKCKFDVVGGDTYDDLNNEIGLLKEKIAYLEKNNVDLANGIIDFVRKNENLRKENERLHNKNEELEKCIDELNKDIDVRDAMLRASFK